MELRLRNAEQWRPTKFVRARTGLRASRDPKYVAIESRGVADIIARHYERALRAHASGRLLDMGCGYAPLYETYRDLIEQSICADWANTLHKNPYLDVIVDLNQPLPFGDENFQTVLLTDVLEHIADPMQLMREIGRITRKQGKLIAGVPFFYWLHEEPYDYYRYTEYALRRFCNLSHLNVIELYPYGGLPDVLVDILSKGVGLFPKPFASLLPLVEAPGTALSSTTMWQRFSKFSGRQFPLGYLLVAEKPSI